MRPRRLAAAVVTLSTGILLGACGPTADGPAVSACSATLDGAELDATSGVVAIDAGSTSRLEARSPVPVPRIAVELGLGPLRLPVVEQDLGDATRRPAVALDVAPVVFVTTGRLELVVTVGDGCEVRGPVTVGGRHPLTTLVGALAGTSLVLGLATVVSAVRLRRRLPVGEDVQGGREVDGRSTMRGAIGGAAVGAGAVILAQQAGLASLAAWMWAVVLVGAVAGAAWARPRP